jgi:group I intron endonuclease
VGASNDVQRRIRKHLSGNGNRLIAEELSNGFKIDIIECNNTELDELEQFLIEECNSLYPNGYNLESGGRKGTTLHDDTKSKLREANLGKKASEETKSKMSKTRKGKSKSEEHKAKISAAQKMRLQLKQLT